MELSPKSSFKLVDAIIGLLQRDRIEEALEKILLAITFAGANDMTTEAALRMTIDDMVALMPPLPQKIPFVPQVFGWDHVYYGDAAFRDEEK